MSPGAIWLSLQQTFGDGLDTWYYRDIARRQILKTHPLPALDDDACEIHALTYWKDWLNLIWSLKSFYWHSGARYRLVIHEDGTVSDAVVGILQKHFPGARIIRRQEADSAMAGRIAPFARCKQFRDTNALALKIFDFGSLAENERLLIFDSDILFFRKPVELMRRIEDKSYQKNTVNQDIKTAYALPAQELAGQTGLTVDEHFNSGLGLIFRDSLNLQDFEQWLAIPGFTDGHFWRLEQTLFALSSFQWGTEFLPSEYNVVRGDVPQHNVCRHYVGGFRPRMYREGIRKLQPLMRKHLSPQ